VENRPVPLDFERADLEREVAALGAKAFQGRQLFQWLWKKGTSDFGRMTNLSREWRERLAAHFSADGPVVASKQT